MTQIDDLATRRRSTVLLLDQIEERLERWAPLVAALILACLGLLAVVKALYKPLWFDEIISILIARLPNAADMWAVAKSGADGQPPGYDYIIRSSVQLLHNDPLGLRVPSIAGFLVFCWSLYKLISASLPRTYGLVALVLPALGGTWYYATEGRPYGLLLGLTGLAALSWQSIALNKARSFALTGLFLSLFVAINIHFFAPLNVIALALCEATRTLVRKKLDWSVWLALGASPLGLLPYLSVIRESRANSGDPSVWFARPSWYASPQTTFEALLSPALFALVLALCVCLLLQMMGRRTATTGVVFTNREEAILNCGLAISFALVPFFGVVVAKYVTHMFFSRYVIGAMLGLTLSFCFLLRLVLRDLARVSAVLLVLCCCLLWSGAYELRLFLNQRNLVASRDISKRFPAPALQDGLPLVIADEFHLFDLRYYARPELLRQIFYLSSETAAKKFIGFTIGERIAIGSAPYFKTQVVDYTKFIHEHKSFNVFDGPEWLVAQLLLDRAKITVLQNIPQRDGAAGNYLLRVQMPE